MSRLTTSSEMSRRRLFGATASVITGTAAAVVAAPALAGSFRPALFPAPTGEPLAHQSGMSAIEILSDEIVGLVRKRRVVNTAIDKLKATLAYTNKHGNSSFGDPFGFSQARNESLAAQASLGIDVSSSLKLQASALSQELAAREAVDDLIEEKMRYLKSQIAPDATLASLQKNTLEGARTEMLVAV